MWAGLLAGGPSSAIGGAAALYLDEILRDPPTLVTAWSTEARANVKLGPYTILLRRGERPIIGSLPRTRVEASLLDMADHASQDELTDAVVRAFTAGATTANRLRQALSERGRISHGQHLQELCVHASHGIESALEWHFHRKVLDAHGLPAPTRQPSSPHGRSDARWEEFGLRLELDGLRDHTDGSRDWFRDNAHKIHAHEDTLRYGWNAATKMACRASIQVEDALRVREWTPKARPCGLDCERHNSRAA